MENSSHQSEFIFGSTKNEATVKILNYENRESFLRIKIKILQEVLTSLPIPAHRL